MRGSRLTCFFVRVENDLFLMRGSIDVVFVWVVECDLVLVCGLKTTWF